MILYFQKQQIFKQISIFGQLQIIAQFQQMYDTNEIRESLMRIKQSQAELLKQLKTQHDTLQSYMPAYEMQNDYFDKKTSTLSNRQSRQSFQSSLDSSKSQGNMPYYKGMVYNSTSAGADDILETNYKKIEQLLVKQRKLYEENHALQQENESLLQDYRQIKKLLYQSKEAHKDNNIVTNYLLNQIIYQSFQNILLEVPNIEITAKAKKNWNKFKIDHPKLFSAFKSTDNTCEQSQAYLQKLLGLLDQDFKVNTIKTKQQQIDDLKQKISHLINMNNQISKNKEEVLNIQQKRLMTMQIENSSLAVKVKMLEKQIVDKQRQNLQAIKKLQSDILTSEKQIQKMSAYVIEKEEQIESYKQKISKHKNLKKSSQQKSDQLSNNLKSIQKKLKQKQEMYQSQLQLNRKQNVLVQRMGRDIVQLKIQLQGSNQRKTENQTNLYIQNDNLRKELGAIRTQLDKYRDYAQRQINSLLTHTKQIKSQHGMLIKQEQNARQNQMRYREMVAIKKNHVKFTQSIDHLWSVKQIQYNNIINTLALFK